MGRKPNPEKKAPFCIRLDPDIKRALEAEARARGTTPVKLAQDILTGWIVDMAVPSGPPEP